MPEQFTDQPVRWRVLTVHRRPMYKRFSSQLLASLIRANLVAFGDTGWRVTVVRPASSRRRTLTVFRQGVSAAAILLDVALVVVNALRRGERLWADD